MSTSTYPKHGLSHGSAHASPVRGGPTDPSHDDELRKGILFTEVSRRDASVLVALFVLLIFALPIGQAVLERAREEESPLGALLQQLPTKENLARLEKDIEQMSYAKDFVQPRVQLLLSSLGREGNTKTVIGRDDFLFYKPGIAFLSHAGFLQPGSLRHRERVAREAGETLMADPRPAILAFDAMLKSRGIQLILFPVPDKAMLQPRELHGRVAAAGTVARSRDFAPLIAELEQKGVRIFDPTPLSVEPGQSAKFLAQDTHWTPTWMQQVASELAAFVRKQERLPPPPVDPGFARRPESATRVGDLVDMLKLAEGQTHFLPQKVELMRVVDRAGADFEPDPEADVLLLGDSFSNIFAEEFMGWGSSAGLAAQLAVELGRPLDVIAQNDSGAFATRAELALQLGRGEPRLERKKVVIWEFASRELAVGNWKHVDWTVKRAPTP